MFRSLIPFLFLSAMVVPTPADAQLERVTVRVDGLSCPFCAYSLEKKLKEVDGVAKVSIDIEEATATLLPSHEEAMDFSRIPRAVEKAGFTPREVRAFGIARLEGEGTTLELRSPEGERLFGIIDVDSTLSSRLVAGGLIEFEGTVESTGDDRDGLPLLSLTRAGPAKEDTPNDGEEEGR